MCGDPILAEKQDMKRKILLGLLLVFVLIQFIRPAKNQSNAISANHISNSYPIPTEVGKVLKKACNDCHSNYTVYPWYSNIQPVAGWLQNHVNEGKEHLNFDEFLTYTAKDQAHAMEEMSETVKEGEMPLPSYTWIHKDAVLTETEKLALTQWANQARLSIMQKNNITEGEKETRTKD